MNPLLVVFPYHNGDIEIARKALKWIAELGSCKPHSLLLCADSTVPRDQVLELMDIARPHFEEVRTMLVTVPVPRTDIGAAAPKVWPPNVMFLNAARQVKELFKFNFLWLEPDAIPLYAGWLDDISDEFDECPYRFMGSIIKQQGQEGLPPEYLNGVAVYPNDAFEVFDKIASVKDSSQAFDIGSASVVVARSLNTPLIQHYYGTKELPPVFVETRAPDSPKNHVTLDFIPKDAAIFHRSKDGKLIELLRAKRNTPKTTEPGMVFDTKALQGKVGFDSNTSIDQAKSTLEELKEIGKPSNLFAPEIDTPLTRLEKEQLAPIEQPEKRGPGRPKKVETVA